MAYNGKPGRQNSPGFGPRQESRREENVWRDHLYGEWRNVLWVDKKDIMLRCAPEASDDLLPKKGVKVFDLTGKPLKGWLLIGPEATKTKKVFDFGFL